MDIQEEKNAFLNVYVNYKDDFRKIQFNEETEQFMWRKNNVSDTEVEYVHLMNQRWYAWLACAKSKAQKVAVPEGFVLVEKTLLNKVTNALEDAGMDCLADQLTEAQEQVDISKFDAYTPMQSRSKGANQ